MTINTRNKAPHKNRVPLRPMNTLVTKHKSQSSNRIISSLSNRKIRELIGKRKNVIQPIKALLEKEGNLLGKLDRKYFNIGFDRRYTKSLVK